MIHKKETFRKAKRKILHSGAKNFGHLGREFMTVSHFRELYWPTNPVMIAAYMNGYMDG